MQPNRGNFLHDQPNNRVPQPRSIGGTPAPSSSGRERVIQPPITISPRPTYTPPPTDSAPTATSPAAEANLQPAATVTPLVITPNNEQSLRQAASTQLQAPAVTAPSQLAVHHIIEQAGPKTTQPGGQETQPLANATLLFESNPFAAIMGGIEQLIKYNGMSAIGYVSILQGILAATIGGLIVLRQVFDNQVVSNSLLGLIVLACSVFFVLNYMFSYVVCVAASAQQTLSLRQVFRLIRKNFARLVIIQVIILACSVIGFVLGIVPGIFILSRWSIAPFMIFENDHPSIFTALRRSNDLVRGRTYEMSGIILPQMLLLSTGLLGFAAMAAGPSARYQQLRRYSQGALNLAKPHFLNLGMTVALIVLVLGGMGFTGTKVYAANKKICYNSFVYKENKLTKVDTCVRQSVCKQDILCRANLEQ